MAPKTPAPSPFDRQGSAAYVVLALFIALITAAVVLLAELGWAKPGDVKLLFAAAGAALLAGVAATLAVAGSLQRQPAEVRRPRPRHRSGESASQRP
jgi:hypothetical protein